MDEDQLKKFPNWYDWQLVSSSNDKIVILCKSKTKVTLLDFASQILEFVEKIYTQRIQSFFNSFASTALAISAKLLLKYPFTTFVKAKS